MVWANYILLHNETKLHCRERNLFLIQYFAPTARFQWWHLKDRMIGFFVPPKASYAKPISFAVTFDSVEVMIGIDFFPGLPDDKEKANEARFDLVNWG